MPQITPMLIVSFLQVLIAFGLVNVWLFRFNRATKYRGAGAQNMKEEFSAYGLPGWSLYVVGFFKLVIALVMIIVLFIPHLMPTLGIPALILISILMVGAISMHIKVKDSLIKILPAISMLLMSVLILLLLNLSGFGLVLK